MGSILDFHFEVGGSEEIKESLVFGERGTLLWQLIFIRNNLWPRLVSGCTKYSRDNLTKIEFIGLPPPTHTIIMDDLKICRSAWEFSGYWPVNMNKTCLNVKEHTRMICRCTQKDEYQRRVINYNYDNNDCSFL